MQKFRAVCRRASRERGTQLCLFTHARNIGPAELLTTGQPQHRSEIKRKKKDVQASDLVQSFLFHARMTRARLLLQGGVQQRT